MKDRLLKFLNKEQLSSARFAEIIGVQPSSISHILSGRNKPGFDFIQKTLINFPSLNADWLIMGKGSMLRNYATQRDLFSDGGGYVSAEQEKISNNVDDAEPGNKNEGEKTESIGGPEISDTSVNKTASDDNYKSDSDTFSGITNVNTPKSVSRIVIFYTDKSFDEYSPA